MISKKQTKERNQQNHAEQNERADDLIAGEAHNLKFKLFYRFSRDYVLHIKVGHFQL